MTKSFVVLMLALSVAFAQNSPPAEATGSIGGTVLDAGSRAPIPGAAVLLLTNTRQVNGTTIVERFSKRITVFTDAHGRYQASGLAAGQYPVSVSVNGASFSRVVTLGAGQNLGSVDFHISATGVVSGKVIDQNQEPVPGITVFLIGKEYQAGVLRAFYKSTATTNDHGEYRLERAEPGRAYLVRAERLERVIPAMSEVPADAKLRRPFLAPTYYPSAAAMAGTTPVVLHAGERREGVDIRMVKSASYCIDGTVEWEGGPGPLRFWIDGQHAVSGPGAPAYYPTGVAGLNGQIRICDLAAGEYKVSAEQGPTATMSAFPIFGAADVTIANDDSGVRVVAHRTRPLTGQVVWATPAGKPETAQLRISLDPMTPSIVGQTFAASPASIPGAFYFPNVFGADYAVRPTFNAPGLYVKEITYNGASILHEPMRLRSAPGDAGLRVTVARDGGTLRAAVTGEDGKAAGDAWVAVVPASASQAAMAATLVFGEIDQDGVYIAGSLPPGKYHVLASGAPLDTSPETIASLWRARPKAKLVEIVPGGTAEVKLEPVDIW
ncbi:MAG: carboxypeptidase-like regulatory domain-containing protein [Acidobacteriia bacterium]|nr:carboxypeptidase-like regulatory domain-containing protein [Terriglobia bacterium]